MTPQYPPHISMLKAELDSRRSRNSAYSLRSFSRDLGLTPSIVSELLRGRKGLSQAKAKGIAKRIQLSPSEIEIFLLSIDASHSRAKSQRIQAQNDLKDILSHRAQTFWISQKDFELIKNWYHQALLELIELEECDHSISWFAKKVQLPESVIEQAIDRLMTVGLLKKQKGKFLACFAHSETTIDIPSMALKNLHSECIDKAKEALFSQNVHEREITEATFAFDISQMADAKQELRNFQKKFALKYNSKSKNKNSVYQLAIQFFRLDKGERK
jgi:uncharacterized protein (TIGR02147 family)